MARGLSGYIDALADQKIKEGMESWAKMDIDFLASYPDFLAFGFIVLLTGKMSLQNSSMLAFQTTEIMNYLVLNVLLCNCFIYLHTKNYNEPQRTIRTTDSTKKL